MNDHIALLSLTCWLTVAACSSGPDSEEHASDSRPAVVADASRSAPGVGDAPAETRASIAPCAAPSAYARVAIGELLDHPDTYDGALVQTIAPIASVLACELKCLALQCEQVFLVQTQMVGPAGELDLEGGLEMLPADGSGPALVWGTIESDGGPPVLVVEGACENVAVPCGLYGPDCPSTMSCVLDDCAWNGGNCGINPPGTCELD